MINVNSRVLVIAAPAVGGGGMERLCGCITTMTHSLLVKNH